MVTAIVSHQSVSKTTPLYFIPIYFIKIIIESRIERIFVVQEENLTLNTTELNSIFLKKKELGNYSSMSQTLYCTPHYVQLFARNGNYDEGFGLENYKRKWLQKSSEPASIKL